MIEKKVLHLAENLEGETRQGLFAGDNKVLGRCQILDVGCVSAA